jgi:serine phosphatase RsbU (regulator of sigma subunit)
MDEADDRSHALAHAADRVCSLILNPAVPREVVDDEIDALRRLQKDLFPGQEELFKRIYLARVCRLLEQFRDEPGPSFA